MSKKEFTFYISIRFEKNGYVGKYIGDVHGYHDEDGNRLDACKMPSTVALLSETLAAYTRGDRIE